MTTLSTITVVLVLALSTNIRCKLESDGQSTLVDGDAIDVAYLTVKAQEFHDTVTEWRPNGYFVFFGAGWCGHCQKFKTVFKALAERSQRAELAVNPTFIMYEVDVKDPVSTFFKVNAFPTMFYIKDGMYCIYGGPRDHHSIEQFFTRDVKREHCQKYMPSYPGWKEQLLNSVDEVYTQAKYEASIYMKEYPNGSLIFIAVITVAMLINFVGLLICCSDYVCPKKITQQVTSGNKENDPNITKQSQMPSESATNSKKVESDPISNKSQRKSTKPEDGTEELQNIKNRQKND